MLLNTNIIYILVHDQNIIIEKERNNHYCNYNYKYLFLGLGDISKLDQLIKIKKVIICRNLIHSIDKHKNLLAFSGWYALVKNNLIKTSFVTLFEYDVEPISNFYFNKNYFINGFVKDIIRPFDTFFYKNKFIETLFDEFGFSKDFSCINDQVYNKLNYWCCTSNFTIEKYTLIKFVNWYYELIVNKKLIENEKEISQIHERIISVFALLNNIKINYNPNIINHQMLNSHNFKY